MALNFNVNNKFTDNLYYEFDCKDYRIFKRININEDKSMLSHIIIEESIP